MQYQNLPHTDCRVSVIALGTWVFGGSGWGGTQEKNCINAVAAAQDSGINFIDTAPIYGAGRAEKIVGKAIQGKRHKWIIATKCSSIHQGSKVLHDLSAKSIKHEIDDSLKRLNVSYIDLYQCHWPDLETPIEETIQTLIELKKGGKIRHFGVSNFTVDVLKKIIKLASLPTVQNQYSILERSIEKDILPFIRETGIGMLTYGPLAGGILSGKYVTPPLLGRGDVRRFFYKFYDGDKFIKTQKLLEKLKKINRPMNQLALNWARQQPGITSVLVGCRNIKQVEENVAAMTWELSPEQLHQINIVRPEDS